MMKELEAQLKELLRKKKKTERQQSKESVIDGEEEPRNVSSSRGLGRC